MRPYSPAPGALLPERRDGCSASDPGDGPNADDTRPWFDVESDSRPDMGTRSAPLRPALPRVSGERPARRSPAVRRTAAGTFTARSARVVEALALAMRRPGFPRALRAGGRSVSDHRECVHGSLRSPFTSSRPRFARPRYAPTGTPAREASGRSVGKRPQGVHRPGFEPDAGRSLPPVALRPPWFKSLRSAFPAVFR